MAISLENLRRGKQIRPPRMVVFGPHKIGKTTFATSAPSAIVIPTEDGLDAIDATSFPLCTNFQQVLDAIGELYSKPHQFGAIVLDSLDWTERLIWAHTAEQHGKSDIEAFGYGKGYLAALDHWKQLLDGLDALRNHRNMAVICLAHQQVKRFDAPDVEPYDRYQIKLHDRASALVQEWADIIGFAQHETLIQKTDVGFNKSVTRGMSTGQRVLHLVETAAWQAGCRYPGMPSTVPLSWPHFIAAFSAATNPAPPVEAAPSADLARAA